jgi:hypothetical protein
MEPKDDDVRSAISRKRRDTQCGAKLGVMAEAG